MKTSFLFVTILLFGVTCRGQEPIGTNLQDALNSYLVDSQGSLICFDDFLGTTLVIDYWYTGCGPCSHFFKERLRYIKANFTERDDITFISVSADSSFRMWQKSVHSGLYTTTDMINLYTGGRRFRHRAIEGFDIHRYPTLLLVNKNGTALKVPGIVTDTVDDLCRFIEKNL